MSEPATNSDNRNVSTGSGSITDYGGVQGGVQNIDAVMGSVNNYYNLLNEVDQYHVSTLGESPYPGLRCYTDQDPFAGREVYIHKAATYLGVPSDEYNLAGKNPRDVVLFIVGASGCGKSSFARAGLLPRVSAYYNSKVPSYTAAATALTPGANPIASMSTALCELGISDFDIDPNIFASPAAFWQFIAANTPKAQRQPPLQQGRINIMLIDQFEELFTVADAVQRDQLLDILNAAPSFNDCRTHIIATLRVDYLDSVPLSARPILAPIASNGISLEGLQKEELQQAIQKPVGQKNKAVEDKLVQILTQQVIPNLDAAPSDMTLRSDPRFLPLLQVTLKGLWESGWMREQQYQDSFHQDISYALQTYATSVLLYVGDNDQNPRPAADQQEMLDLLLELIQLDPKDPTLDTSRQRRRSDLIAGSPQRENLLNDLITARLAVVSAVKSDSSGVSEIVVNLTHQSLMQSWPRLRDAIAARRVQSDSGSATSAEGQSNG